MVITDHVLTEIIEGRIIDENYVFLNEKVLELDLNFLNKLKSVLIYSSDGKLIYNSNHIKSAIDLSGFIDGIYIVVLNLESNNLY